MNTCSTPISNLSSLGYGPPSPLYLSCFPRHNWKETAKERTWRELAEKAKIHKGCNAK